MYLLDTNILIWISREGRGNPSVFKAIQKLLKKTPEETCISTITVAEIYENIQQKELDITEKILGEQIIFPVTTEIAKISGYYWQEYHLKLKELHLLDCIVAATAKDQNAKVVTLNDRHFPMRDIEIINPLSWRVIASVAKQSS